ncbi:hypothetical protein CKO35_01925 [Ectothiorhodospira shaposhnikovii]|nr:hypothetical protein [Ectothiorhodospira shaposhnikovii]
MLNGLAAAMNRWVDGDMVRDVWMSIASLVGLARFWVLLCRGVPDEVCFNGKVIRQGPVFF